MTPIDWIDPHAPRRPLRRLPGLWHRRPLAFVRTVATTPVVTDVAELTAIGLFVIGVVAALVAVL